MLIEDIRTIGNHLYTIRKRQGLTQAEVAEKAGLSDRTYADIERGVSSMRAETLIRICDALSITPNEIFTQENDNPDATLEQIAKRLRMCSVQELSTALKLLDVYLLSIHK
ncbi:MAG: helix-turn-helix transcriptional regulator [Clostridia bacterium]|nr:helix-turn-helix transcriptional regulator [Clostridia bacterium]